MSSAPGQWRDRAFFRAAIEYNTGRTAEIDGRPLAAGALRVLAVVTGLWLQLDAVACRPASGLHSPACLHRQGSFPISIREVARLAYGSDAGGRRAQVRRALAELASPSICITFHNADGTFGSESGPVLVSDPDVRGAGSLPTGRAARLSLGWRPSIQQRLLGAQFQYLPDEVVRRLDGTAFRLWLAALNHPRTVRLQPGGSAEFAVTGDAPSVPLGRLGLGGLTRPAKVREALRRAANAGNRIQGEWRIDVLDRVHGGLKFAIRRTATAQHEAIGPGEEPERPVPRTPSAPLDPAIWFEIEPPDRFLDTNRDIQEVGTNRQGGNRLGEGNGFPEPDARVAREAPPAPPVKEHLKSRGRDAAQRRGEAANRAQAIEDTLLESALKWKPMSPRQRRLVESIESRGIRSGCSSHEHLMILEDGINDYYRHFEDRERGHYRDADPLSYLVYHDEAVHPRYRRSAPAGPPESPLQLTWRRATGEPLAPTALAELVQISSDPFVQDQGGEPVVLNAIGDMAGQSADAILERVRRIPSELARSYAEDDADE